MSKLLDDPLWYKDAVIYELHVRAFSDSNGDGIGDFRGLMQKLDYLEDLGVTAIWLLPFYPSPLKDDGYDIAEYTQVNSSYGSLRDFRRFLRAAHARGLRVITELVINHTSIEHPWFQRARRSPPGSKFRDFYVWSDTPDRYNDARIIFGDFETSNWSWDPVARAYYWHRFYTHQPDLNFENPEVQKALFKVLDFWMDLGVDGMRLDAVPYLYEREGTNCENLPETHEFLKKLRRHIDSKYKNRMLLAEANQWPEDAAEYFGDGDECHMNFHFPLMPRMFMALLQENNFPILDILEQTPRIPESCQWAVFLRNHDELTLEMVTDQDRDYMYRQYADEPRARINLGIRRRLAPLLKVRRKMELMNGLLMSLPGTPVLYYGDEIGMGDNFYLGDRNGVRTPMQWSGDRNAGFSRANPQKLFLPAIIDPEYHYEAINVEAQEANPSSLLWWTKRLLALRKQYKVFGRGETVFLRPENPKVLAFIRSWEDEEILVVANLSRFCQYVELDLRDHAGITPVEAFGRTRFPRIGELPYLLTLGPHAFYWFSLEKPTAEEASHEHPALMRSIEGKAWEKLLEERKKEDLERVLPLFLRRSRWFRGKAYEMRKATIVDVLPLKLDSERAQILVVEVDYLDRTPERYVLPLSFAGGDRAAHVEYRYPSAVFARLADGILFDSAADDRFGPALLAMFHRRRTVQGRKGQICSVPYPSFRRLREKDDGELESHIVGFEQTNTSIVFDQKFMLKIFRRLEDGENPDLEIGRYLTETREFKGVPPLAGALEYKEGGKTASLGILQGFVPNFGDAWRITEESLDRTFDRVPAIELESPREDAAAERRLPLLQRAQNEVPELARELLDEYLVIVEVLGERTADMHRALESGREDPAFVPEQFSTLHQRSLYQAARTSMVQSFELLRKNLRRVPEEDRALAAAILDRRSDFDARLKSIVGTKIEATRTRVHGDFHLGQVLYTGNDVSIIDFEGEPARSLGERRLKQSPLRDVAGMLRSFHYASVFALRQGHVRPDDIGHLAPWAELWHAWVEAIYLRAYLERAAGASFIPKSRDQLGRLLDFFLIEKCTYELGYELNNRPDWVSIPLHGLAGLIDLRLERTPKAREEEDREEEDRDEPEEEEGQGEEEE